MQKGYLAGQLSEHLAEWAPLLNEEEFAALAELITERLRAKKAEGPEPASKPIEVGQVWVTAGPTSGAPNWATPFAIGVTRIRDEWVYFRPLQLNATENRCTRHDFPTLYTRLPFRCEADERRGR